MIKSSNDRSLDQMIKSSNDRSLTISGIDLCVEAVQRVVRASRHALRHPSL
jgi:hypothetical protein